MALPVHLAHLLDPAAYPHPVPAVRLIETHISWVLLAGEYAYKIKKPVDFGFLDFSTLDRRRFCCDEEVRLNRRLAPDIYLDVVAVTASGLSGADAPLDWAVRMRAFPADATLDRASLIVPEQVDAIADRIARFHDEVDRADPAAGFGSPEAVMHPVRENFRQLRAWRDSPRLTGLEAWSESEFARLHDHFAARKADGFVREGHGDLHLGNIAWVENAPVIFDGIEFNPGLRHIDVISEIAFLCMDLIARTHAAMAWRFLNRYLEQTGDYAGLAAFRFYLVYRALVRAKVASLRAQPDAEADATRYLDLAERLAQTGQPALLLMHGYSGSGKTWLSQRLLETAGAIRLRSDVERKRLFNLHALAESAGVADIYTPEAGRRTFAHLRAVAGDLLAEGYAVIVDATFLGGTARAEFAALADLAGAPWFLVSPEADAATLKARVANRRDRADDASEADLTVLESQICHADPLDAGERAHDFVYRAGTDPVEFARTLTAAITAARTPPDDA